MEYGLLIALNNLSNLLRMNAERGTSGVLQDCLEHIDDTSNSFKYLGDNNKQDALIGLCYGMNITCPEQFGNYVGECLALYWEIINTAVNDYNGDYKLAIKSISTKPEHTIDTEYDAENPAELDNLTEYLVEQLKY